jgi:hypothetical protein
MRANDGCAAPGPYRIFQSFTGTASEEPNPQSKQHLIVSEDIPHSVRNAPFCAPKPCWIPGSPFVTVLQVSRSQMNVSRCNDHPNRSRGHDSKGSPT